MDEKSSNTKKQFAGLVFNSDRTYFLAAVFSLALIIRLLFSLVYWVDKPITHDAREYILLADNMLQGKGYGYTEQQLAEAEHHERAPVYPVFLYVIFILFGKNFTVIKILQSLISALLPLIMYGAGKRLFSEESARIAALLIAFYPPLFWGTGEFLSETIFTSVAMLGFYYLIDYMLNNKITRILPGAFWLVLAAHIKPVLLMVLPFIALWLWLRHGIKNKTGFIHAFIFGIAVLAFIIPWTARNLIAQEKFILIASEGGITFWTGNNSLAVGDGDMAANPQIKEMNNKLRKEYSHLNPAELEEVYYKEAGKFIRENPLDFIVLLIKKGFYFWFPVGRSMSLFSIRHQLVSHLSYFPVLLLAFLATLRLLKKKKLPALPYISMGGNMLACVLFFPQERYRIPLVDPWLLVLAGYYLHKLLKSRVKN